MSGALTLYTAPAGALHEALAGGWIPTGPWVRSLPSPAATAARVAEAVADGGRHLDVDAALHVVGVVETVGTAVGSIAHPNAARGHVRDHLIGGLLAERFGAETVVQLVLGPVAGCTFPVAPTVGLLRTLELGLSLTGASAIRDTDLDDLDAAAVATVRGAVERAARARCDLIGVLV